MRSGVRNRNYSFHTRSDAAPSVLNQKCNKFSVGGDDCDALLPRLSPGLTLSSVSRAVALLLTARTRHEGYHC